MRTPDRTRRSTPEKSQQLVAKNYRLILAWSTTMYHRRYFPGWTADTAAVDLVDEKFDPKKGTIGTFLYNRMYSRVRYQWAQDRGLRWDRRNKRWVPRAVSLDSILESKTDD